MNSIEAWLTQPGGVAPRLKELRESAKLKQPELAGMLGWAQSKISKAETGKQLLTADEVAAWVRVCRGSEDTVRELQDEIDKAERLRGEWRQRRSLVGIQHNYDELARGAKVIRNFETVWVPGLLQTPGYAHYRALESVDLHDKKIEEVPATVAARLDRRNILYESGRRFEFVVGEEALTRLVCPPDVMAAQLAHLDLVASGISNVTLGVLPIKSQLKRSPQTGFIIFDDIAIVENQVEELTYRNEAARKWNRVMDDHIAESVFGDEARTLIRHAKDALKDHT